MDNYNIRRESIVYVELRTRILVKMFPGKTFHLNVDLSDSVGSVKQKIELKEGIPTSLQGLRFGSMLEDLQDYEPSLADCNIRAESSIVLLVRRVSGKFYVMTPSGSKLMINAELSDSIYDIEQRIQMLEGIPPKNSG